jgi:hypothetical protein
MRLAWRRAARLNSLSTETDGSRWLRLHQQADLKGMGHRAGVHFTIEEMNDIVAHKVAAAEKR